MVDAAPARREGIVEVRDAVFWTQVIILVVSNGYEKICLTFLENALNITSNTRIQPSTELKEVVSLNAVSSCQKISIIQFDIFLIKGIAKSSKGICIFKVITIKNGLIK